MSKDPAVLFYTSDFISGTLTMTDEQRGKYILLLCLQHQKGHLTKEDMLNICHGFDKKVFAKFNKDKSGLYYNVRMSEETEKRKKYTESRRRNRDQADNENLFIYLMIDQSTGYYKIGSSVSPKRRLIELQGKYPKMELLNYWGKTTQTVETYLHNKFKGNNVINEFFDLSKKQVKEIEDYLCNDMKLHMYGHMENEDENININNNINQKSNGNPVWEMVIQNEWKIPFTKIPAQMLRDIADQIKKYGEEKVLEAIKTTGRISKPNINYFLKVLSGEGQNGNNTKKYQPGSTMARATFFHDEGAKQRLRELEETLKERDRQRSVRTQSDSK